MIPHYLAGGLLAGNFPHRVRGGRGSGANFSLSSSPFLFLPDCATSGSPPHCSRDFSGLPRIFTRRIFHVARPHTLIRARSRKRRILRAPNSRTPFPSSIPLFLSLFHNLGSLEEFIFFLTSHFPTSVILFIIVTFYMVIKYRNMQWT